MSQPNKAFVLPTSVSTNYPGTGATIHFQYVVLDPSNAVLAGGQRLATADFDFTDYDTFGVHRKIANACRVDMNDPTLEVALIDGHYIL